MKILGKMVPHIIDMMTHKTDTISYPAVEAQVSDRFRGALKFTADRCVGCKLCMRVCPADAIEIIKIEGEEKKFKCIVHMDKCIFCGQCVESCNKDALHNTRNFELAQADRASLRVEI